LVVTPHKVAITSSSGLHKTISFSTNRWGHFIGVHVLANVDEEAKELFVSISVTDARLRIGDGKCHVH